MRISTPKGTSGEIDVPAFGNRVAVFMNGRMVWNGTKADDDGAHGDINYIYLDHLAGGTYEIFTRPD
jgi:hypothetical protein